MGKGGELCLKENSRGMFFRSVWLAAMTQIPSLSEWGAGSNRVMEHYRITHLTEEGSATSTGCGGAEP